MRFLESKVGQLLAAGALMSAMPSSGMAKSELPAVDITSNDIAKVLDVGRSATDHNIRVVEMGKYQLSVAVIHRSSVQKPNGDDIPPKVKQSCGRAAVTGEKLGPSSIEHSSTDEVYIITSGSGTLVTGGEIVEGVLSNPEGPVAKTLNGPSCRGRVAGKFKSRLVKAGDISVIPAGVPHGWMGIASEVTYLSVRPDLERVLPKGYVHPALLPKK